jgi:hypothetical protein
VHTIGIVAAIIIVAAIVHIIMAAIVARAADNVGTPSVALTPHRRQLAHDVRQQAGHCLGGSSSKHHLRV